MPDDGPEPASDAAPRRTWMAPPPNRKRALIVWTVIGVAVLVALYFSWGVLGDGAPAPKHAPGASRAMGGYVHAWNARDLARLDQLTCASDRTTPTRDDGSVRYSYTISGSQLVSSAEAMVRGTFTEGPGASSTSDTAQLRTHDLYLSAMKLEPTGWRHCVGWTLGDLAAAVNKVEDCATIPSDATASVQYPSASTLPQCGSASESQTSSQTKLVTYQQLDGGSNYRVCAETTTGKRYTFERSNVKVSTGSADACS